MFLYHKDLVLARGSSKLNLKVARYKCPATKKETYMAKRKRKFNEITIKIWQKQGRGKGLLKNYKPWIHIQDIPSKGLSTRIKGVKAERVHHLLSRLELSCFYCLDWSDKVLDIREQYPLYLYETLALASLLNIKHPKSPKTKDVIVMTTDFLVTIYDSLRVRDVAITVKYSKDLAKRRTLEKLELERKYWERRKIEWKILTEKQINITLIKNIQWLHPLINKNLEFLHIHPVIFRKIANFMKIVIHQRTTPLRALTDLCDHIFQLQPGTSLLVVRYLIANRIWIVDMNRPIQPEKPLSMIKIISEEEL